MYQLITLMLFSALTMHNPIKERADVKNFERYDSTQTCIISFYPPKMIKKYKLETKSKWRKYRRVSFKDTVIIKHKICSDEGWYRNKGMYPTRAKYRYVKIFGIHFKRVSGN